jgi:uncharacterized iron-regulated protein
MRGAPGCTLHDADGAPVSLEAAAAALASADVVLFGELHGVRPVHALEHALARELHGAWGPRMALGAEMLESDDQLVLDEYLAGLIPHRHLAAEAKLWDGHETDYRPLVELARENGLRFVATNAPRRYAGIVAREGLAGLSRLSPEALRLLAPLPIEVDWDTPGYREMLSLDLPMGGGPVRPENLVAAQALKDATMAHFVSRAVTRGTALLHVNGAYHSQGRGGICWWLERARPELRVRTVTAVLGEPGRLEAEHRGAGDYVAVASADPA